MSSKHRTGARNEKRVRKLHALLVSCSGALVLWACGGEVRPDIVLITVDTLRADRLGCYGYELETSPVIDRLAAEALVFENAFAQAPTTCPSLTALMSSRLPADTGVRHNLNALDDDVSTLAELLKAEGYTTAAFVSNYVLREGMGFEQGFDLFNDEMNTKELNRHLTERVAPDAVSDALAWLDAGPKRPFFLWVHFQDPHGPYTPPGRYSEMFFDEIDAPAAMLPLNPTNTGVGGIPFYQRIEGVHDLKTYAARYLGEIRYLDDAFGRLYDRLQEHGAAEAPIAAEAPVVVFTADHGEGLGEHDYYFAHGEYLYNDQIRVPLVMKAPGRAPERIERPAALVDVMPTLLALAGAEPPGGIRGINLLDPPAASRPIWSQTAQTSFIRRNRLALIWNGYKLIHTEPDRYELYNLVEDPAEQTDLAAGEPARAAALIDVLRAHSAAAGGQAPAVELDEETRRRLESLGY